MRLPQLFAAWRQAARRLTTGIFIMRMRELTDTAALPRSPLQRLGELPEQVLAYRMRGTLFFGAVEKALSMLAASTRKSAW